MKFLRFLAIWSICFLFFSCSNDFELEADWKDVPVVHGLLSVQDTAHYIRVEKAFLQSGGDATKIAQIADSLYYGANVQVQLQRVSNGQTFNMQRVNGAQEGYPRQDGAFATVPNILYKIGANDTQLKAGEQIRLIINRGETIDPVQAQTTVLGEMVVRDPTPITTSLNLAYERSISFSWDATPAARFFDVRLILHFEESAPGNPNVLEPKTLTWILTDDLIRQDTTSTRVRFPQGNDVFRGEEFYKFMQANLNPLANGIRRFNTLDIQITGAGQEVVEQLRIAEANAGVTSSQAVPVYTNLSEGRGIFSSKAIVVRAGLQLNSSSQDSLRNGIYTRELNFK